MIEVPSPVNGLKVDHLIQRHFRTPELRRLAEHVIVTTGSSATTPELKKDASQAQASNRKGNQNSSNNQDAFNPKLTVTPQNGKLH